MYGKKSSGQILTKLWKKIDLEVLKKSHRMIFFHTLCTGTFITALRMLRGNIGNNYLKSPP